VQAKTLSSLLRVLLIVINYLLQPFTLLIDDCEDIFKAVKALLCHILQIVLITHLLDEESF